MRLEGRQPARGQRHAVALGHRCRSRERQERSLGRLQASGARRITERPSHLVAGLIAKRRELAGIIADLERRLIQHRADLTHIDGVLRVLATNIDPESIKPKRVYRRSRYFARNELSRLILATLRTAAEPLSVDDLATQAMTAKGFDRCDLILRSAIRHPGRRNR
jgi:hypothetical protein